MRRLKFLLIFFLMSSLSFAQTSQPVEMADTLRSEGKIYIVIAVLCIIFIGIAVFLISIDRKISRMEKEIGKKNGE